MPRKSNITIKVETPICDSINAMLDDLFCAFTGTIKYAKLQKQYNKMLLIHKASMMCKENNEALLTWQLHQMENTLKEIRSLKSKPFIQ